MADEYRHTCRWCKQPELRLLDFHNCNGSIRLMYREDCDRDIRADTFYVRPNYKPPVSR